MLKGRLVLVTVACLSGLPGRGKAQAAEALGGPTYLRHRPGAADWGDRTGGSFGYGYAAPGWGWGPGFFGPPVVAGSWYARPYPYHFDYYRHRWGAPAPAGPPECPCASDAPPDLTAEPAG